jgi:hypothetical protein
MTAEIVNLREARKRKARAEKETRAEANRLRHGLPKLEKRRLKAEDDLAARRLEGHRLSPGEDDAGA